MSWFPGFKLRLINRHTQSCVIFNIFSILLLLRQEAQSVTKKNLIGHIPLNEITASIHISLVITHFLMTNLFVNTIKPFFRRDKLKFEGTSKTKCKLV